MLSRATRILLILLMLMQVACGPLGDEHITYADFLEKHRENYPACMDVYMDRGLMATATHTSPIYICLEQQRGRLYVNGTVAADWPVSTGKEGHATPTGTFPILEKKKKHNSSVWGTIVDKNDICVVESADSRRDRVPPGGAFLGARMNNWQRLTASGIGIHTGPVRCNQNVSHGCIRTPGFVAEALFNITKVGTRVTITRAPEKEWPGKAAPTE